MGVSHGRPNESRPYMVVLTARPGPQLEYLDKFRTNFGKLKAGMERRISAITQYILRSFLCVENSEQAPKCKNSEFSPLLSICVSPGFSRHAIGLKFERKIAQIFLSVIVLSLLKIMQK